MTTPDPITTAREALERLARNNYSSGPSGMILHEEDPDTITAALDYAEKLKAERDEALRRFMDATPFSKDEVAKMCSDYSDTIEDLTFQLEQAEMVIKPFIAEHKAQEEERSPSVQDSDRPHQFYVATYEDLRRAATLTKGIKE